MLYDLQFGRSRPCYLEIANQTARLIGAVIFVSFSCFFDDCTRGLCARARIRSFSTYETVKGRGKRIEEGGRKSKNCLMGRRER